MIAIRKKDTKEILVCQGEFIDISEILIDPDNLESIQAIAIEKKLVDDNLISSFSKEYANSKYGESNIIPSNESKKDFESGFRKCLDYFNIWK